MRRNDKTELVTAKKDNFRPFGAELLFFRRNWDNDV